jgi:hypothetical protein
MLGLNDQESDMLSMYQKHFKETSALNDLPSMSSSDTHPERSELRHFDFKKALGFIVSPVSCREFFREKFMLAYSDCKERFELDWEITSSKGYNRWEELRHDKETNFGKSLPYDMLFAFTVLPWSPEFKEGSDISRHFLHLWKKQYPDQSHSQVPLVPPLSALKRLHGSDVLINGMWIILVRMPRPCHGKPHVPISLRKDLRMYSTETEAEWILRKNDLKRKYESEVHPTESQLYITLNGTLIQEVAKNIVCAKCGAKGHHHEKSHDDVYSSEAIEYDEKQAWHFFLTHMSEGGNISAAQETELWNKFRSGAAQSSIKKIEIRRSFPTWMNVLPYPKETLALTKLLTEEKGLTLHIRQAETKIPLRLARKLMMDGLQIEGDVYASGVGSRKRVRREEEENTEKLRAGHFLDTSDSSANRETVFLPVDLHLEDLDKIDIEYKSSILEYYFRISNNL